MPKCATTVMAGKLTHITGSVHAGRPGEGLVQGGLIGILANRSQAIDYQL